MILAASRIKNRGQHKARTISGFLLYTGYFLITLSHGVPSFDSLPHPFDKDRKAQIKNFLNLNPCLIYLGKVYLINKNKKCRFDLSKIKRLRNSFSRALPQKKKGWNQVRNIAARKLDMLHYAKDLNDLLSPPGNRLEALRGNLEGYYSIRINNQWQIVFRWDNQPFDVSIIDYH